jgi:molecular chaperone GrpE (heat shock protein)
MSDMDVTAATTSNNDAESEHSSHGERPNAEVPSGASPVAEAIEGASDRSRELTELVRAMEESNRISAERERVIDRLYEENQRLRAGELQQALMPVLRDLMRLFDDLQKTVTAYSGGASLDPGQALREWEYYRDSALDILFRQGVEPCAVNEGTSFDPREHRACGTVTTSEQSQDRTIARVIRAGFRSEARIIRTADVEVYRAGTGTEAVRTS